MALPKNIRIGQDPIDKALDVFSRMFHGTVQEVFAAKERHRELTDRKTVQVLNKILVETDNADLDRTNKLLKIAQSLEGSKFIGAIKQTAEDYLKEEIKRKTESVMVTNRYRDTIAELEERIKNSEDSSDLSEAYTLTEKLQKNYLTESDIVGEENQAAHIKTQTALSDLKNLALTKNKLFAFDDPEQEGFQILGGEDMGEFTKTALGSAFKAFEDGDYKGSLSMLRTNVPAAKQADVRTTKSIEKAIRAENKRLQDEKASEQRIIDKIARRDYNSTLTNKIESLKTLQKETEISKSKVQPFSASIKLTNEGDVTNVKEIKDQAANTIYQLHKKYSDSAIPEDADTLFEAVEKAIKTGDKDAIKLAQNELATWWSNNTSEFGTLDYEKSFEFISDAKEKNREQLMIDIVDIYKMTDKGAPKFSVTATSNSGLSEGTKLILESALAD